jgi:membrane-bound lytic murein transglycosylase B
VPGLPVFAPVLLPPDAGALVAGGIVPSTDWAKLQARGARTRPGAASTAWQQYPLGVVDLVDEPRNLKEYRTGTPNFFAITHYNHSYFYAASVADLAQAIAGHLGLPGLD